MQQGRTLAGHASDVWTRSYTIRPEAEFQVVGGAGNIEVTAGTGPTIEVKAERVVRASSDAAAQSMVSKVQISEDVSADKVVLRNEGLGGIIIGVDIQVNFHVEVPPATRLRVHAANGDITLTNILGAIVASSVNGSITGTSLGGGIDARSTNGNVTIDLASVSKEPIDIRVVNGEVALTLPATANAKLEASCTNGSIDVTDVPLQLTGEQTTRRVRGRLNEGGTPVEMTSTNGNIRVRPRP
jgi:hypothetical protein